MERTLIKDTLKKEGQQLRICGWASKIRDHGSLVFVDVRDWTGKIQVVIDESKLHLDKKIGLEYVLEVIGTVRTRDEGLVNENIETGRIEIGVEQVNILNESATPPFPLDSSGEEIDEAVRLKYRYIDIRRERVRDLIEKRHRLMMATREWFSENGFVEVQTPLLTVSSPEGARDYLVPSRIHKGKFYALPQAPQQYKQLLMVGGMDKYFQIAPCFRDEDPRADRHSGDFYQIDVECSFVKKEEFFDLVEPYFKHAADLAKKEIKQYPIPRISYKQVLEDYGTDKPDLRFDMRLLDFTEEFVSSDMDIFKNIESAKGILVDREFTRKEIDEITEQMKEEGAAGMAWFSIEGEVLGGNIAKYFPKDSQESILNKCVEGGYEVRDKQTIFVFAGEYEKSCKLAGILRNKMGELLGLKDPNILAFAWIVDFPMFEWDEKQKKWDFGHNPFSMPQGGLEALEKEDPKDILAEQYDVACNGYELGSGSIRNHHPATFIKAFEIVGYSESETREKFGHMISAFEYGAPPHGGYALGFDRFMMILFDESNIKEVYAFPKSNAQELMTGAPREVSKEDLEVLGIEVKKS
jgi:aspartyl-tRNA synthetase